MTPGAWLARLVVETGTVGGCRCLVDLVERAACVTTQDGWRPAGVRGEHGPGACPHTREGT